MPTTVLSLPHVTSFIERKLCFAAIDEEPELPGQMPDAMWSAIANDRDAVTEALRLSVQHTKAGIRARLDAIPASIGEDNSAVMKAQRYADAELFITELLDSVETLTSVCDVFGAQTLADLMYLQSAILRGNFIDHYPLQSSVLTIVRKLPSSARWEKFIKVEESCSNHIAERNIYVCTECGSANVQRDAWVHVNTGDIQEFPQSPHYCENCDGACHVEQVTVDASFDVLKDKYVFDAR